MEVFIMRDRVVFRSYGLLNGNYSVRYVIFF